MRRFAVLTWPQLSGVICCCQVFLDRDDVISAFHEMLDSRSAHVIAVICAGDGEREFEKHFILYSRNDQLKLSVKSLMSSSLSLSIQSEPPSMVPGNPWNSLYGPWKSLEILMMQNQI